MRRSVRDLQSWCCFFLQAEDGIRDLVRSRGLGDVYKRQKMPCVDDFAIVRRLPPGFRIVAVELFDFFRQMLHLSLIHI